MTNIGGGFPGGYVWQPLDADGNPYASGKLYTYQAGTTTNKATYPTEADAIAGTNANGNPIEPDARGVYGPIFLLTDGAYKFVLKDSSGSTVATYDNINATTLRSSSFQTRIQQVASNPLDYGAVGDGVADESTEVQAAIDAATGVVDLLGKTYRCDSAITMDSGLTLRNGTLDFSNCADDEYVKLVGTRGSAVNLSSNAAAAAESIALDSVSGLSVGDWLYVKDDTDFNGGSDDNGEVVQIESISGTTVTLTEPLHDGYETADNATAQKLNVKQNVIFRDLVIACSEAASGAGRALYCEIADNVFFQNVQIEKPKGTGIEVRATVNASFLGCTVLGKDGTGIGYEIAAHSRNVEVTQCRAIQTATGFRVGQVDTNDGVCRLVNLSNVSAYGCDTEGITFQTNSEYCTMQGVVIAPSGGSVQTDNGANNRNFGVADITSANYDGWTVNGAGTGAGVKGTGGATGYGVHGVGGSTSGAGVYGAGTAGNASGVEGAPHGTGSGVKGTAGSSSGYGVHGVASTSGVAVYGEGSANDAESGVVRGYSSGTTNSVGVVGRGPTGVQGESTKAGGYAVIGNGFVDDAHGLYGSGSSNYAPLHLEPHSSAPSGPNQVGDIYVTTAGVPYVCTSAGTPGTWTKISAT